MTAPIKWEQATSPILWSNIGINWNTAALGKSVTFAANVGETQNVDQGIGFNITFGANVGQTLAVVPTKPVAITLALNATQATTVAATFSHSTTFAADLTSPVTDRLDAVASVTFAVTDTSTLNPGTTFTDEPVYPVSVGMVGSTSFLWNEEDDVTTTWTKVDYPN